MRDFEDDFDFKEGEDIKAKHTRSFRGRDTYPTVSIGTLALKASPEREVRILAHQRRIQKGLRGEGSAIFD